MSILRLGDSLKGLRQAVSPLVVVYSSGGIQIKSQRSEKVDGAQSWRSQVKLSDVPSQWSCLGHSWLSQQWCQQHLWSAASQGSLPEPWCPGVLLGVSYAWAVPQGLTSAMLTPALPPPPWAKPGFHHKLLCWDKLFWSNWYSLPKASGTQSHSYQAAYSKDSETISQEAAKG